MKYFAALVVVITLPILFSCVPKQEIVYEPPVRPVEAPPHQTPVVPEPPLIPSVPVPTRQHLSCEEDTLSVFNRCGLDVLPFMRVAFFDMDGDGRDEMIAGTQEGGLVLYKRSAEGATAEWKLVEGYFDGIKMGAFSSPAVGDIDGDGLPEVVVGSGGFSSESGKVHFYKNAGTPHRPAWQRMNIPEIDVGNDATPALVLGGGRPDLIVGSSTGVLSYYRNTTVNGRTIFRRVPSAFRGMRLGLYAVPAAVKTGSRTVVIAGNDRGRLYIIESRNRDSVWHLQDLGLSMRPFTSPALISAAGSVARDLVVADGSGQLSYFRNLRGDYRTWEPDRSFFAARMSPGRACTPAESEIDGKKVLVVGNIHGELRLFEYAPSAAGLPWVERAGYFRGIKLPGFSKGVLTMWEGRQLLITGQHDGLLRAFAASGPAEAPVWEERPDFFRGVPKITHAAPAVYDLDGDGRWELIVGSDTGSVRGFRLASGKMMWEEISASFADVSVARFSQPAVFRDGDRLYLLIGSQDGTLRVFSAAARPGDMPVFRKDDEIDGIKMQTHSAPSAVAADGAIGLSVGDYNGNLRHFACRRAAAPVRTY